MAVVAVVAVAATALVGGRSRGQQPIPPQEITINALQGRAGHH